MNIFRYFFVASFILLTAMGPNPSRNGGGPDSSVGAQKNAPRQAPDFTLKDVNGRPITLSSYKGKVVLVNFWATWCPPCKAEMPSMNRLYHEMKSRGLEVIAISTDTSVSAVKDYLAKNRLDFAVLIDEGGAVARQYRVFSMPTTFLVDRNGMIVDTFFGEEEWTDPDIRKKIGKHL